MRLVEQNNTLWQSGELMQGKSHEFYFNLVLFNFRDQFCLPMQFYLGPIN